MASSHRPSSRHRSPSPSNKRHKRSHNRDRDRSHRSRSRSHSEERHRHRSSSHRHHRSSRHDDRSHHESSRQSRHRDHVSSSDTRSSALHQSDATRKDDADPPATTKDVSKTTEKAHAGASEDKKQDSLGVETEEQRKQRERRERIEAWKREKEAQKKSNASESTPKPEGEATVTNVADATTATESPLSSAPTTDVDMRQEPPVNPPANLDTPKASATDVTHTTSATTFNGESEAMDVDEKPVDHIQESKGNAAVLSSSIKTSAQKPANKMNIRFGLGKTLMKAPKSSSVKKEKAPAPAREVQAMEEVEDPDVDPLDAYMKDVNAEARKASEEDKARMLEMKKEETSLKRSFLETESTREPKDEQEDEDVDGDPDDIIAAAMKMAKRKDLPQVDHSKMDYEPFRKDFYIEPPEFKEMTKPELDTLLRDLETKVRGKDCPKPITKWTQCGMPVGCLEVVRKLKFTEPTPIQKQAIPVIMNGRDTIGIAKTGSGKTIAFLLPMFRHIKDQRPLEAGEGPIALIMTPTRELATQIHRECKPFLKVMGLRAVCAYGGSPIKDQIADLKRGCEIIVCTPGRMIDLLCANAGRVTNLARVTYLVMDEADRMFDMGFEPQVMGIIKNVCPNRQTVLFSATFPRNMEALARKVLKKPVEITVGGKSVVCSDVTQVVEIVEEKDKFNRLLQILGEELYKDDGEETETRALVFTDRHESADQLCAELINNRYSCQSLHGGKEQMQRDFTLSDFKKGDFDILIATSVAARGLDVKQLKTVVNYDCPNHMEDYVHRAGRTGRAGNKGTAYTFIEPQQNRFAAEIAKALEMSGQEVPADLVKMKERFEAKVKEGKERAASSGFGGKGLERLDRDRAAVKRIQQKVYGEDDNDEVVEDADGSASETEDMKTPVASMPNRTSSVPTPTNPESKGKLAVRMLLEKMNSGEANGNNRDGKANVSFSEEFEINDYGQKARWKVTNKDRIAELQEMSGAAITTRGSFFPDGKQPGPNERKLHLFIEGTEKAVEKASKEIRKILVETKAQEMLKPSSDGARYKVV